MMKGVLYVVVLFLTAAGIIFLIDIEEKNMIESQTDSGWNLVWEDEFDGDQLDTSKWNYDIGNGFTTDDGTYVSG
ncbi:hypothetical protein ACPF7I_02360 [Anoxybacillus sp. D401a]|uniref:hypothetical protein n=1 Tax=Anoxybacillus sp. D401a TaxID=575112 RepID=UPI003D33F0C4